MFLSIITINRNNAEGLKRTLESVASQTCRDFEHIIIDGASTDESVDIIKEYVTSPAGKNVSYWVSEPDSGIYDAMNKGIEKANGEWVNFMNSGDVFFDSGVLKEIYDFPKTDTDILFGDSIIIDGNKETECACSPDSDELLKHPTYRHGASFVKTTVHKQYPFDLSKKEFGYALDYNCIYQLKLNNYKFKKINKFILKYESIGISSLDIKQSYLYIYRITKNLKPFYAASFYFYHAVLQTNSIIRYISLKYQTYKNHFKDNK